MNAPPLDDIVRQLEDQQDQTAAHATQLRQALTAAEDELARLTRAIAALRGTPSAGASGLPAKKAPEKRKAVAPAASRSQVAELITATLGHRGVMQEEKLKIAVENQLVAAGFSRMGYALRFKEAMADARFDSGDDGVTLRPAQLTTVNGEY
ncbi:MAG TPA: hypothetical protein PKC18_07600, partial [Lacipirellulaceae bacterium]|nr:hypothetical protein [Lacipirellulaceae bacterium]